MFNITGSAIWCRVKEPVISGSIKVKPRTLIIFAPVAEPVTYTIPSFENVAQSWDGSNLAVLEKIKSAIKIRIATNCTKSNPVSAKLTGFY